MVRRLAVLGLGALLVLAVSALSMSAAQAADFHCTSTSANCWITSDVAADNTLAFNNNLLKCTSATIKGTSPKTTMTLTLAATYEACMTFGVKEKVDMNSCDYLLHLVGAMSPFAVSTDVVCTGEPITITPTGMACITTIAGQTGLAGITVTNGGGTEPTDVTANINVTGITYTETGAECATPGTHTNGVYKGTQTLTGFEDLANGAEGTKVGLHVF